MPRAYYVCVAGELFFAILSILWLLYGANLLELLVNLKP